jgi:hypothetical protein
MALTLALSHRMGEGTAIGSHGLMVGWAANAVTGFFGEAADVSPSLGRKGPG